MGRIDRYMRSDSRYLRSLSTPLLDTVAGGTPTAINDSAPDWPSPPPIDGNLSVPTDAALPAPGDFDASTVANELQDSAGSLAPIQGDVTATTTYPFDATSNVSPELAENVAPTVDDGSLPREYLSSYTQDPAAYERFSGPIANFVSSSPIAQAMRNGVDALEENGYSGTASALRSVGQVASDYLTGMDPAGSATSYVLQRSGVAPSTADAVGLAAGAGSLALGGPLYGATGLVLGGPGMALYEGLMRNSLFPHADGLSYRRPR